MDCTYSKGIFWENTIKPKFVSDIQPQFDYCLQDDSTQLALIAKEKGVSVEELCLRHNDITANYQKIDGDIKFWVEVR